MTPGVYPSLSMPEYLAIPAVSASLIRELLDRCPRAAWFQSWLNPNPPAADDTKETDRGTVAHAMLLCGSTDAVTVIDPYDHITEKSGKAPVGWTNKSIREARDVARCEGTIPILKPAMNEISAMFETAMTFIESLKNSESAIWQSFQWGDGDSELTCVWTEPIKTDVLQVQGRPLHPEMGQVTCKMRPDRISKDRKLIVNYKTTSSSVEPDRWGRTQFLDYYLGGSFYRRGAKAVFGTDPAYVFLCQETTAPYLCSLVGMDPTAFALGDMKVEEGLRRWARCVEREYWPAYPDRVCYPQIPAWESARWEERDIVDYGSQP